MVLNYSRIPASSLIPKKTTSWRILNKKKLSLKCISVIREIPEDTYSNQASRTQMIYISSPDLGDSRKKLSYLACLTWLSTQLDYWESGLVKQPEQDHKVTYPFQDSLRTFLCSHYNLRKSLEIRRNFVLRIPKILEILKVWRNFNQRNTPEVTLNNYEN